MDMYSKLAFLLSCYDVKNYPLICFYFLPFHIEDALIFD